MTEPIPLPDHIKQRKSPAEVVDELFPHLKPKSEKEFKETPYAKIKLGIMIQDKRAKCQETFETWGTPEEIAANAGRLPEPKSHAAPSVFFPCPPAQQNQSSSDVLE